MCRAWARTRGEVKGGNALFGEWTVKLNKRQAWAFPSSGILCWLENKSQCTELGERKARQMSPSHRCWRPCFVEELITRQAGQGSEDVSQGCESWQAEEAEIHVHSSEGWPRKQSEGRCRVAVGTAVGVWAGPAPQGLLACSCSRSSAALGLQFSSTSKEAFLRIHCRFP